MAALIVLVVYAAMAVALFSNTWAHPTTWSIGTTGDPQEIMWFLGWGSFAATHGQNPLFSTFIDFPTGVNMMWNGSMVLPSAVLTPITLLGGPVLAFNVLTTAALALSAWTGFLLIARYVPNNAAAAVGGALYGFSPFMTAHSLGHPHITAAFVPPLLFLLLDDIVRIQRRPPLVSGLLLGLAAAAQLLIGEELLATAGFVGLLLLCLAIGLRPTEVRARAGHALRAFGFAALAFAVLAAVPLGFQFLGPQHVTSRVLLHEANVYVSDALSFFIPTRLFLLAPQRALAVSDRFSGNVVEINSYVGVILALLLAFIAVRFWRLLEVRLATLGAVLIAILSMGITIHYAGDASRYPVFTLGLAFPLLQRFLPGRLMLYLTFLGWLALSRLPVLVNILPSRLMLYFYLLAGLLLAVLLNDLAARAPRVRWFGRALVALALIPLLPALPYPSTPEPIPAFFTDGAASKIAPGSVALVIPYAAGQNAHAMLWQAAAGMPFRMPEGYAFIPDLPPNGERLDPPPSATQDQVRAVAAGTAGALSDEVRSRMLADLASWQVTTVIIGPMTNEQSEVELFASLLGQPPQQLDGVFIWAHTDAIAATRVGSPRSWEGRGLN